MNSNDAASIVSSSYKKVQQLLDSGVNSGEDVLAAIDSSITHISDADVDTFVQSFGVFCFMLARESLLIEAEKQRRGIRKYKRSSIDPDVIQKCASLSGLDSNELRSLFELIKAADKRMTEKSTPSLIAAIALTHYLGHGKQAADRLEVKLIGSNLLDN